VLTPDAQKNIVRSARRLVKPLFENKAIRSEGPLWCACFNGFWNQLIVQTTAKKIETEEVDNCDGARNEAVTAMFLYRVVHNLGARKHGTRSIT